MSVTTIKNKLQQAQQIKAQIRTVAATKDIDFPEDTPFAQYPAYIATIKGHLEEKEFTPTAAGGEIPITTGYDGFKKVVLPAEPNLNPEKIAKDVSIFGVVGEAEIPEFNMINFFGGTLQNLIINSATSFRDYCFYQYKTLKTIQAANLESIGSTAMRELTALTTVNAPKLKTIGTYALYGCTALTSITLALVETIGSDALYNCKAVTGLEKLIAKKVDSYGCYYLGYNGTGFDYEPAAAAALGTYAFQYAKVKTVAGPFSKIDSYAFQYCNSLTKIHPQLNGLLGSYGFGNCPYVNDVDLAGCNITSLGTYAFYCLGASRTTPAENRLTLDFRGSSFKTVDQYSIGGTSSAKLQYADIYLPDTVTTVNANAFAYGDNIEVYFQTLEPPTLSATTCFSGATNYKIFIPYRAMHAYTSKTNWTALTANIIGYAPGGTFEAGATLPTCDDAGYALTWYSDAAKTEEVTTVTDAAAALYCAVGEKIAYVFTASASNSAYLTVTGSNEITYTGNPIFIPTECTSITVNIVLSGEYEYKAFNGSEEITFPYTVEITGDMELKYFVMDGSFNADFVNATWAEIQYASLAGAAAALYASYVGTTRPITLKNGKTMNVKLVNCTDTMYEKSDGSGNTGLVFQFEELWPDTKYMNSTSTNSGGWNASYMRQTVMPLILSQLPDDLAAVLATVNIKGCNSGNSGTINTSADKLFLPAEREIFASRVRSRTEEWNILQRWQWYAQHDTNADRIKKRSGSASWWWLRSPYSGYSNIFVCVYSSGAVDSSGASYSGGVAPGFCI